MLDDGTLRRYIDEFSITGLTSNPTIFDEAIGEQRRLRREHPRRRRRPARPAKGCSSSWRSRTCAAPRTCSGRSSTRPTGVDGWVSMEVSPLLANDTSGSIEAAARIYRQADRPNLFVKIPGTPEGVPAIEESIFAGVPINVTLLFSREQYLAAAEAYLRGIERRIAAGLDPQVASVASLFVSRWDKAVAEKVPAELRNRLGIAIARRTYRAYRELLASATLARARPPPAHVRSVCCGPAPEPRIPRPRTPCTSKRSRRPTPSTPCPRRRCTPSPSTARSAARWPRTAATPRRCWRASREAGHRCRRARDPAAAWTAPRRS